MLSYDLLCMSYELLCYKYILSGVYIFCQMGYTLGCFGHCEQNPPMNHPPKPPHGCE